ncbi:hypothetical protein RvY_04040 [Ramazzottius varieornatus]|uniref:EB domain-containing protein n=1 Tax=Ramazzottius varieornatus TaxID=947166 RepID=A0A1D1UVU0_RAMVA|nr:hypothetical protein RvY_04040 [Ramazzottius varieornatus]
MYRGGVLLLTCVIVAALLTEVRSDDPECGSGSRFRKCKMSNGQDGKCNSGRICRPLNSCEVKNLDCPRATSICRKGRCVTGKPNNTCESDGWECQEGFRCSGGVCFPRQ